MFSSREIDQRCHFKLNFEDQEVYSKVEEELKRHSKSEKSRTTKTNGAKAGIKNKWHI